MKKVSGRLSLAMSSIAFNPSPVVTPGSGSAEIVAEFSWLNCSMAAGDALVEIFTTADSGTIWPVTLRTKYSPSFSGLSRNSCGTCGMMS